MPESFGEKLQEVYETVPHQRSLLRHVFTNVLAARHYLSSVSEDMMESAERRWLVRLAKDTFKATQSLLTETVLNTQLNNVKVFTEDVFDKRSRVKKITLHLTHESVRTEYNVIVSSASLDETPEWLIETIKKQQQAKELLHATSRCLETLQQGDVQGAVQLLGSDVVKIRGSLLRSKPVRKFSDVSWRVELVKNKREHPELYAGIKCGMETPDREMGGFFRGELTLIVMHTGVGKSTLLRNVVLGLLAMGANVLLVANEEVEEQVCNHFDSMVTKMRYNDFKRGVLKDAEIDEWVKKIEEFQKDHGELFVQEIAQFTTVAEIESTIVDLQQQGNRVDVVVLDYLDHLKPMERAWSETDEQNKATAELKSVATGFRVAVLTASQADTKSFEMEEGDPSAYNVRGSKQKSGSANVVLFGRRAVFEESGTETDLEVICVKNRDGANFRFWARINNATGLMQEIAAPRSSSKRHEEDAHAKKKATITQPPKSPVRQPVKAVTADDMKNIASLEEADKKE